MPFIVCIAIILVMSKTFCQRLKSLRIDKELSQRALANILGVTQVCYLKWEKGENEPNIDMILRLCQVFNVSPNYLLGHEDATVSTINNRNNNSVKINANFNGNNSGSIVIGNNNSQINIKK